MRVFCFAFPYGQYHSRDKPGQLGVQICYANILMISLSTAS